MQTGVTANIDGQISPLILPNLRSPTPPPQQPQQQDQEVIYYETMNGDTLEGVALKTGVRVSQLKNLNKLYSTCLFEGQKLIIKSPKPITIKHPEEVTPHTTVESSQSHPLPAALKLGDRTNSASSTVSDPFYDAPVFQSALSLFGYDPLGETSSPSLQRNTSTASQPSALESFFSLWDNPNPRDTTFTTDNDCSDHGSSSAEVGGWTDKESSVNLAALGEEVEHVDGVGEELASGRDVQNSSSAKSKKGDWSLLSWFGSRGDPHTTELDSIELALQAERDRINAANRVHELAMSLPPNLITGKSEILSSANISRIRSELPTIVQFDGWTLLYSLLQDGADLVSFFRLTGGSEYSIIIVQTSLDEVFGGFVSSSWTLSKDFYGTGECFVFKFDKDGSLKRYSWNQNNNFFLFSNRDKIGMGGGGGGFAFVLDSDLAGGGSYSSETFSNPCLTQSETFRVKNVEVWGFESLIKNSRSKRAARISS